MSCGHVEPSVLLGPPPPWWVRYRPRLRHLHPRRVLRDWRFGRHSGIPACCRTWFTAVDWFPPAYFSWRLARWERRRAAELTLGYVRCPACRLLGRAVDVHLCREGCGWLCREGYGWRR